MTDIHLPLAALHQLASLTFARMCKFLCTTNQAFDMCFTFFPACHGGSASCLPPPFLFSRRSSLLNFVSKSPLRVT